MRWAAIDFETATRNRDSACALGVVIVEEGREIYRQAWLIRPPNNDYEWRNIDVHGIRPDDTSSSPSFDVVWNEAMELIEDRPLVAHNATFDVGVLSAGCSMYGVNVPDTTYHCSVRLARKAFPGLAAYKLPIVAAHVGAQLNHHDALSDAAACSKIIHRCFDDVHEPSLDELSKHFGLAVRRLTPIHAAH